MLKIFDVADAFLSISSQTPKKLQKLCYYAYVWHLVIFGYRLFDERFQAWVHGPVNPELYKKYRDYGWNEIPQSTASIISPDLMDVARSVYDTYGIYDGNSLEILTHRERPWQLARGNLQPWERCENEISDDDIRRYYGAIYEQANATA